MDREQLIERLFTSTQAMQVAWKTHFYKVIGSKHFSPPQMFLLMIITKKQPITGSDLASEMQISRSAVTQLLDGLDKLGLIDRNEDRDDRRLSYITLSKNGHDTMRVIEQKRKEFFKEISKSLSETEIEIMISAQTKLTQSIDHVSNTKESQ